MTTLHAIALLLIAGIILCLAAILFESWRWGREHDDEQNIN